MSTRPNLRAPASYISSGSWPTGAVAGPRVVLYARAFARAVQDAMADRPVREVARQAGLSHTTLLAVLHGERWPDMITIAKLEESLRADLWPGPELRRPKEPASDAKT